MNNIFDRPQTNFELIDIGKKIGLNVKVIMKDELKGKIKNGNFIINLQNSNQNGSHWTALYAKNGKFYFSDSFGVPISESLIKNTNINNDNLFFNTNQIQDIKSQRCGFFALYFLYIMNQSNNLKDNLKEYIDTFNLKNVKQNDTIIKNIFSNIII